MDFFEHPDALAKLSESGSLTGKLEHAHELISNRYPFIARIALALYDPRENLLETFLHSSGGRSPLTRYSVNLEDAPSLVEVIDRRQPRVVADLSVFDSGEHEHTQKIAEHGYRASYTLPLYDAGQFFGFLFYNSFEANPFTEECLHYLDLFGHLISLVVIHEVNSIRTLLATVSTAREFTDSRDAETGAHIDRMARYSRLIARELAEAHSFSDEYIAHIFLFAPLHDIGKIAVPDQILLKPAKLTPEEVNEMRAHVARGRQLVDGCLRALAWAVSSTSRCFANSTRRVVATAVHEARSCSGLAIRGYPRLTKDLDLWVEPTRENGARLLGSRADAPEGGVLESRPPTRQHPRARPACTGPTCHRW